MEASTRSSNEARTASHWLRATHRRGLHRPFGACDQRADIAFMEGGFRQGMRHVPPGQDQNLPRHLSWPGHVPGFRAHGEVFGLPRRSRSASEVGPALARRSRSRIGDLPDLPCQRNGWPLRPAVMDDDRDRNPELYYASRYALAPDRRLRVLRAARRTLAAKKPGGTAPPVPASAESVGE